MKRIGLFIIVLILVFNINTMVFANTGNPDLNVQILSPDSVKDYPGREDVIRVSITNNSNTNLNQVLAYITMADLNRNMTVNLEDYSADKPVYIETIRSGETKEIELPIRFVYTSKYHLYVTVVTKENNIITSSEAIPIEILGNTKINKPLAMGIAVTEPIVLLVFVGLIYGMRKRKYKVK